MNTKSRSNEEQADTHLYQSSVRDEHLGSPLQQRSSAAHAQLITTPKCVSKLGSPAESLSLGLQCLELTYSNCVVNVWYL